MYSARPARAKVSGLSVGRGAGRFPSLVLAATRTRVIIRTSLHLCRSVAPLLTLRPLLVSDRRRAMPAVAKAAPAAIRADLEQLQGVWQSVAGPKEARFLIAGHRFAFEFVGGDLYMGTFELAPDGLMDMKVEEGPADHKGHIAPCLY